MILNNLSTIFRLALNSHHYAMCYFPIRQYLVKQLYTCTTKTLTIRPFKMQCAEFRGLVQVQQRKRCLKVTICSMTAQVTYASNTNNLTIQLGKNNYINLTSHSILCGCHQQINARDRQGKKTMQNECHYTSSHRLGF